MPARHHERGGFLRAARLRTVVLLVLCVGPARADQTGGVASEPRRVVHVVARGETLGGIASHHGVSIRQIRQWNDLPGSRILSGQRLLLWIDPDRPWYVVRRGDTLSGIASSVGVELDDLRRWNALADDRIAAGQRLRILPPPGTRPPPLDPPPTPSTRRGALPLPGGARTERDTPRVHAVSAGETLSEIAEQHGIGLSLLRRWNELRTDRIYIGQVLRLTAPGPVPDTAPDAAPEAAPEKTEEPERRPSGPAPTHDVQQGDSLWRIARRYGVGIEDLQRWNRLLGSSIRPGQTLHVGPPIDALLRPDEIDWTGLVQPVERMTRFEAPNGPYFEDPPRASHQRNRSYREESRVRPKTAFDRARSLFDAFQARVSAMGRLGTELDGWHIVLDPGHGGIDPGAITRVLDGRGDPVYVVEDEYVFDIALRMYVLLRLHGADVTMTILSPNHLIRSSDPATRTFVHERNEVFNSRSLNRSNGQAVWPKGGQRGLDARIQVASEAFRGTREDRRIFLSLHADSSPNTPMVPMVLYYEGRAGTDARSRRFAVAMAPALGPGAIARGQGLGVLRKNPAAYKVLLEFRNVAYPAHAWALRFEDLRQQDAEKAVNGVIAYAVRQSG